MAFEKGKIPEGSTPFVKGQSGNPNGRPPGAQTSAVRLRRLLEIVQKAKNPVTKETEDFTTLELMDAQQIAKALKGDSVAYNILLDRFEGKVPQKNEFAGALAIAGTNEMTTEQIDALLAIFAINPPESDD